MAKAKQLPSGKWRTRVYSHTEIANGKEKRIYESFTADTKKESEFMAAKFAMDKNSVTRANITVEKAIQVYIDSKDKILSPATIRAYRLNAKNHLEGIKQIQVDKLTSVLVQAEINSLVGKGLSPKTIRNIYGMLTAALKEAKPDIALKCLLPQKIKTDISVPTGSELDRFIELADADMKIVIKLAAFMGLRRSEICALEWKDIDIKNKKLHINKALVLNNSNEYVLKGTKTTSSTRTLDIPNIILSDFERTEHQGENVVSLTPLCITKRFRAITKKAKCQDYRFHDLRHYYASVMLMLGIPDKYAMERMGHSTNNMLKTVYQHTFEQKQVEIANKLNDFFDRPMN